MPKCPICSSDMQHAEIHRVEVDVCEAHGIWLDRSELFSITERERQGTSVKWADFFRRQQRPPVDRDRELACPQCANLMQIETYKATCMDRCVDHGVWLDNGELEAIMGNLRLDPHYMGKATLRLWENKF